MRATSSSQKVMKQLDSLENAISGIRRNISHEQQSFPVVDHSGVELCLSEIRNLKQSMGSMMDLVVNEIDGIKRELYLDFGQNQKALLNDVEKLKADNVVVFDKISRIEDHSLLLESRQKEGLEATNAMLEEISGKLLTAVREIDTQNQYFWR